MSDTNIIQKLETADSTGDSAAPEKTLLQSLREASQQDIFQSTNIKNDLEQIADIIEQYKPEDPDGSVEDDLTGKTSRNLSKLDQALQERAQLETGLLSIDSKIDELRSPDQGKTEKDSYLSQVKNLIGLRATPTAGAAPPSTEEKKAAELVQKKAQNPGTQFDNLKSADTETLRSAVNDQVEESRNLLLQEIVNKRAQVKILADELGSRRAGINEFYNQMKPMKNPDFSSEDMPSVSELQEIFNRYKQLGQTIANDIGNPYLKHQSNLDSQAWLSNLNFTATSMGDAYLDLGNDAPTNRETLIYGIKQMRQQVDTFNQNLLSYRNSLPEGSQADADEYTFILQRSGASPGGRLFQIDNPESKIHKGALFFDNFRASQRALDQLEREVNIRVKNDPILSAAEGLPYNQSTRYATPIERIATTQALDQLEQSIQQLTFRELGDDELTQALNSYQGYVEATETADKLDQLETQKTESESRIADIDSGLGALISSTLEGVKRDLLKPGEDATRLAELEDQRNLFFAQYEKAEGNNKQLQAELERERSERQKVERGRDLAIDVRDQLATQLRETKTELETANQKYNQLEKKYNQKAAEGENTRQALIKQREEVNKLKTEVATQTVELAITQLPDISLGIMRGKIKAPEIRQIIAETESTASDRGTLAARAFSSYLDRIFSATMRSEVKMLDITSQDFTGGVLAPEALANLVRGMPNYQSYKDLVIAISEGRQVTIETFVDAAGADVRQGFNSVTVFGVTIEAGRKRQ